MKNSSTGKCWYIYGLLIVALLMVRPIWAGNQDFVRIDSVNLEQSTIVIGDVFYELALDLDVYSSKKRTLNRYALKYGQKVSYKVKQGRETFAVKSIIVHDID